MDDPKFVDEVVKAQVWLLDNHISSIGPVTATALLRIEEDIRKCDNLPPMIEMYANKIRWVCTFLAIHQGAVIQQLDSIVNDPAVLLMRAIKEGLPDPEATD